MKKAFLVLAYTVSVFFGCAQPLRNASWITNTFHEPASKRPPIIFRKNFTAQQKIKQAALYITVLGIYEATLNNKKIGSAYFAPGFSSYDHRLQYQQYDVTKQIKQSNELKVIVADGWFRGPFAGDLESNNYGNKAGLIAKLRIVYANGDEHVINTDTSWKCATGSIKYAEFYDGELQDTRVVDTSWVPVTAIDNRETGNRMLVPQESPFVTAHEIFPARQIINNNIIDFGQNIAGIVRIHIKANAGDRIKIEHAETLDKDGYFFTGNLREAKATDIYIANGTAQTLEPHFTYHGFRYIRVTGIKPPLNKKDFRAIALYTDMQPARTFTCSDPMLNKLQSNITWSLKSNFIDIPTDCPQRSERLGWTGDAQVFLPTAAFNYNVKSFFTKWMRDLDADMGTDGSVPRIVPDVYGHADTGSKGGVAGWSDAATIIPWRLFEQYGDTALLHEQYSTMKRWVEYLITASPDLKWKANGYGDWYAPGPKTSIAFINQCYFAYSLQLVLKSAQVINKPDDTKRYSGILEKLKSKFIGDFGGQDSLLKENTQTAYVLALQFDMLPDSLKAKAAAKLVSLIHANNDHLATGFLGTPYLLEVLLNNGYSDVAYTLLMQKTMPSWLYPITKGATTIWEKWDAIQPDGIFDTCSLNHYAYGAVGNFLYRYIAGIQPLAPGYKKIRIRPYIGGGLTYATAKYQSRYGRIQSAWRVTKNKFVMEVDIPKGTTAEIDMPAGLHAKQYKTHVVTGGHFRYVYPMKK